MGPAETFCFDQLPEDFDPKKMDRRYYVNERLTPLGRWIANSNDPMLEMADRVAKAVREAITENPGRDQIAAADVAEALHITSEKAGEALYFLGELGGFFASASGKTGGYEYIAIGLNEDIQARYLRYKTIDHELERYFVDRRHAATFHLNQMDLHNTTVLARDVVGAGFNAWTELGQYYSKHENSFKAAGFIIAFLGAIGALTAWALKTLQSWPQ